MIRGFLRERINKVHEPVSTTKRRGPSAGEKRGAPGPFSRTGGIMKNIFTFGSSCALFFDPSIGAKYEQSVNRAITICKYA